MLLVDLAHFDGVGRLVQGCRKIFDICADEGSGVLPQETFKEIGPK